MCDFALNLLMEFNKFRIFVIQFFDFIFNLLDLVFNWPVLRLFFEILLLFEFVLFIKSLELRIWLIELKDFFPHGGQDSKKISLDWIFRWLKLTLQPLFGLAWIFNEGKSFFAHLVNQTYYLIGIEIFFLTNLIMR